MRIKKVFIVTYIQPLGTISYGSSPRLSSDFILLIFNAGFSLMLTLKSHKLFFCSSVYLKITSLEF